MMTDHIILYYGDFKIIEEHIGYLSHAGITIAAGLAGAALVASLTAILWFPALSKLLSQHRYTRWMRSGQFGYILPFAIAALLFPIAGVFSKSSLTFWLFLLFGWSVAAILLYTGSLIDSRRPGS